MTYQKDILRAMITDLDEASDKIPEGFYLKFCDYLRELHKHIEPVFCRSVVQNAPFSVQSPSNPQNIHEALDELIEELSGPQPRRRRRPRCGICRNSGHNRRNCPRIVGHG